MAIVSIIIPTYNRKKTLIEAIESVLSQTFKDFELLVIDDGSNDGTREIMDQYCQTDSRIKYFYQQNNGRSSARNKGLNESTGTYVTFLDSDDLYLPEKIEKQVSVLNKHPEFDLVYCLFSYINNNGDVPKNYSYPDFDFSGNVYPDIISFKGTIVTTPSVMVRKAALQNTGFFDEQMDICEDLDLWRRVSKNSLIYQLREILVIVRLPKSRKLPLWENYRAREYFYNKSISEDEQLRAVFLLYLRTELYFWYALLALRQVMIRLFLLLMIKFMFLGPRVFYYFPLVIRSHMKTNPKSFDGIR